jgi:hypothetical protein
MKTVYVYTNLKNKTIELLEVPHENLKNFFKYSEFKKRFGVVGIG